MGTKAPRRPGNAPDGVSWPAMRTFPKLGALYKLVELATAARFVVKGESMLPNFSRDQYMLVSRMASRQVFSRGDVVVHHHPRDWRRTYIKRIVGLPGEHVRVDEGRTFVDGRFLDEPYLMPDPGLPSYPAPRGNARMGNAQALPLNGDPGLAPREWFLEDDQYFMMGDNRRNSEDSRSFGPLGKDLVVGKVWIRYWPRSAWGIIR